MGDKSDTNKTIILSVYYLVLFIIYQVFQKEFGDEVVIDQFSSLILIIFIISPLFSLFNEIDFYGFKFKKEFNDFKERVSTKLDLFQNTLITLSTTLNQSTNLTINTSNGTTSDNKVIENPVTEAELRSEYEDAKK